MEKIPEPIATILSILSIPALIIITVLIISSSMSSQRHSRNMECLEIGGQFVQEEGQQWTCKII